MINRSHPPISGQIPEVRSLSFEREDLSNGIPLYIIQHDAQPFLTLRLVLRSGARNDGSLPGLAEMTSDLLSTGAGDRNAITFARDIELLGADLGAEAGRDETTLELDVLSRYFAQALPLAEDMVLQPRFYPEEIERERKLKLAAIKQNYSDPDWLASSTLRRSIFGGTPYGHPIEGGEDSIRSITSEACHSFHANQFLPEHGFFILAGKVEQNTIELLEKRFQDWRAPSLVQPRQPIEHKRKQPQIIIVHRSGSAQTAIRIGRSGVAREDVDFVPLRLLNTLFGDYFNSRLNLLLRESMGYTYEAWSYVEGTLDPGLLSIGTSVRGDRVGTTIKAILRELSKVSSEPVPTDELNIVKGYLSGRQALASETPDQVADMVTIIALHNLPSDYYQNVIKQVQQLTPEELLTVGTRYMQPDDMTIVVAGDKDVLEPQLRMFGKPVIVDSLGKPL